MHKVKMSQARAILKVVVTLLWYDVDITPSLVK